MNGWRQKKWGHVKTLFSNAGCLVELLRIDPHGKSSLHLHERNCNRFFVIEGELILHGDERIRMHRGDYWTVAPNMTHQFEAGSAGATVLEIYFTEESPRSVEDDIVRITANALGSAPL